MRNEFLPQPRDYAQRHKQRSIWRRIAAILACAVVFVTTYMLILPAITMEQTTYCNNETHEHTLACYSNPEADLEAVSVWENSVSGAELTGVWADDLIAVAQTQLGCAESSDNYRVAEDGSVQGYTRYGHWYGGMDTAYDKWDAMFVSFCLHYAKIPAEAFPQESDPLIWVKKLSGKEETEGGSGTLYVEAQGYTPSKGDLVFFDSGGDGAADHVGIVEEYCEAGLLTPERIKTIEGDVDGTVRRVTYDLTDGTILGYAVLPDASEYEMTALSGDAGNGYVTPDSAEEEATAVTAGTESGIMALPEIAQDGLTALSEDAQDGLAALSEELETEPVTGFMLWLYVKNDDGTTQVADYSRGVEGWKWSSENALDAINDVLHIRDTKRYLIPVTYFNEIYGSYGYSFREEDAESCPFVYAPSAYNSGSNLTGAVYVQVGDVWYVQVEDTGSYSNPGNPRSNVYFTSYRVVTDVTNQSNSVINLFDYWLTEDEKNGGDYGNNHFFSGINANHALKFRSTRSDRQDGGENREGYWNIWPVSGNKNSVWQGIVSDMLGGDGYPVLAGEASPAFTPSPSELVYVEDTVNLKESLAYLFDPGQEVTVDGVSYKESHRNVTGLLQTDDQGYYYYDSTKNFAEYHEESNSFVLYEQPGVKSESGTTDNGQFFPFNSMTEVKNLSSNNEKLNHYIGMTLTSRFIQKNGGYTSAKRTTPVTFEFSGDDDVWIFIDGVLVADLGGIHTKASVSIDFSTGEVFINGSKSATLREAYETAYTAVGKEIDESDWTTKELSGVTYTTFADNTTHTLRFFYMERGNSDSNLSLKYNLTEIPKTSLYKVDQYGDVLGGARFAVYRAQKVAVTDAKTNEETEVYRYLPDDGGAPVEWNKEWYADPLTGNVYASKEAFSQNGDPVITPAYCSSTDRNGSMVFLDPDGMPYSMAELTDMLGSHFILREVGVPEGYRTTTDEIYLYTDGEIIFCEEPYKTGVWASPNVQITASNTICRASDMSVTIPWYDPETAEVTGTLFAVVLKRNGADIKNEDAWYPVYGSDIEGYTVSEESGINAVIAAAKEAQKYGNNIFEYSGGGMQVTLENLPGSITRYFSYMWEHRADQSQTIEAFLEEYKGSEDPQYFLAYYYTDADVLQDGWAGVTGENTYRVIAAQTGEYSPGFSKQWSTTIEVPNLENRLFFQKLDTAGNLINGARFALYEVFDAAPKDAESYGYNYIYYAGTDTKRTNGAVVSDSEEKVYIALLENADENGDDAVVFSSGEPSKVLGRGICEPDPETGNMTVTIRHPAEGSGVSENTEYYIYPAVNAPGRNEKAALLVGETHTICDYVEEDGTGHFQRLKEGKYYLREISAPPGFAPNNTQIPVLVNKNGVYANAGTPENHVAVGNGVGYLSSTMNVFASVGMIDETLTWVYGALIQNDAADFSAFDAVSGDVIHVGEGTGTDTWKFVKKDPSLPAGYGSDTTMKRNEAMVTYLQYAANLTGNTGEIFDYTPTGKTVGGTDIGQAARVLPSGVSAKGFVPTGEGEGKLCLYTDTGWSDMAIYQDYAYGVVNRTRVGASEDAYATQYKILTDYGNISNLFSSSTFVQVTDEAVTDVQIKKVDESTPAVVLSGAQFRLYRQEAALTGESGSEQEAQTAGAEAAILTVVTGADGTAVFSNLPDGTYYLEELAAPDGYRLLSAPIKLKIESAKIELLEAAGTGIAVDDGLLQQESNKYLYTVTVPNSTGAVMPATGGDGAIRYTLGGAWLSITAGLLLYIHKKRGKEGTASS